MNQIPEEKMSSQKISQIFLAIAFFGLLLIAALFTPQPQLFSLVRFKPEKSIIYNMALNLEKFPQAYEESINEGLFLKDETISPYYHLRTDLLADNLYPNVIIGKEQWLFYGVERSLSDYRRSNPFTTSELQKVNTNIKHLAANLQEQDIDLYILVAPNKGTIYPEYLPDFIKAEGEISRYDQFVSCFENNTEGFTIIDVRHTLLEEKAHQRLYYLTDTHWNTYGAHAVYRTMISTIRQSTNNRPEMVNLRVTSGKPAAYSGDLIKFIAGEQQFSETKYSAGPAALAVETSSQNTADGERLIQMEREHAGSLPTLLVIHDSFFTEDLISYTADSFGKAVFKHLNGNDSITALEYQLIEEQQPDIVILEIAERNLENWAVYW